MLGQLCRGLTQLTLFDPKLHQFSQLRQFHGFGHMPVHADLACPFLVLGQDMRGQGHHRSALAALAVLPLAQALGGMVGQPNLYSTPLPQQLQEALRGPQ